MARRYLILTAVVGVVFTTPILWVHCKEQREEEQLEENRRRNIANRDRAGVVSNPPPPPTGGFVIKRSDGSVAEQFWSAEACWAAWDRAYALTWEAQTEKGLKTESMRGCWSGPKSAPRTAPPAESLPEYRKRRNREAR